VAASTNLTPEQRRQRASIAATERWSREDPKPNAQRAQRGLRARFEREVRAEFPDLDEPGLIRRAEARYRAHMKRIAFEASKSRTAKTTTAA
jgi:hypothetical protein